MSTLRVTHTEDIILEGRQQGTTRTMKFDNISDVFTRVFSFNQQTLTTLYSTTATTISNAAMLDDGSVKYVRITSLNPEPMIVEVNSENDLNKLYELQQGQSYYIYSHNLSTFSEASAIDAGDYILLEDIDSVKVYCVRGAGKVELFAASTDAK